jgi:phosphosulfolactate synthase
MNYSIPFLPERPVKPRDNGLTMMMDKGLSYSESVSFIESSAEFTDLVKFGFGTAIITSRLKEKVNLYKSNGLIPYFGGTLFELFVVRGMFEDYRKFVSDSGLEYLEVSDGSVKMEHEEKLEFISILSKDFVVISEVGYKVKGVDLETDDWVRNMNAELNAGAWKVIAEARESGTIGIYNSDGSANKELITGITEKIPVEKVLWEAPMKNQQVYFISLLGANVNLGNIAPNEVVALEALRLGLRGDTLFTSMPDQFHSSQL